MSQFGLLYWLNFFELNIIVMARGLYKQLRLSDPAPVSITGYLGSCLAFRDGDSPSVRTGYRPSISTGQVCYEWRGGTSMSSGLKRRIALIVMVTVAVAGLTGCETFVDDGDSSVGIHERGGFFFL